MEFVYANKIRKVKIKRHVSILIAIVIISAVLFYLHERFSTIYPSEAYLQFLQSLPPLALPLIESIANHFLLWLDFSLCLACFIAAQFNWGFNKNLSVPLLGLGFLVIGLANLIQTMTLSGQFPLDIATDFSSGFAWWENRLFFAGVLLVGYLLVFITRKADKLPYWTAYGLMIASLAAMTYLVFVYLFYYRADIAVLFSSMGLHHTIELIPMGIFFLVISPLAFLYYHSAPSYFAYGLILSMIPHIAAGVYLMLDPRPYDLTTASFGQLMEVISIALPVIGLHADNKIFYKIMGEKKQQAEEASKAKDRFISFLSYQLRTPITNILGLTQCMLDGLDGPVNERQRDSLQQATKSADYLSSMITELLDISKIEQGKVIYNPFSLNLNDLIQDCYFALVERAQGKNLELQIDLPDKPITLVSDPERLKQVILELLTNAIRFTSEGHVKIEAREVDNEVHISVRDSGIGIPAFSKVKIFEPFFQADLEGKKGGLGLGLTIAQQITEGLQGSLTYEKNQPTGSCFTISLASHHESIPQENEEQPKEVYS